MESAFNFIRNIYLKTDKGFQQAIDRIDIHDNFKKGCSTSIISK